MDYALADNTNRIKKWLEKTREPQGDFTGHFGAKNSLGTAYYPDGRAATAAGNGFYIKLVRAKGHKAGFYVQTCYPK